MPGSADNEAPVGLTKGDRASLLRDFRTADREQSERARASMRASGLDPDSGVPLNSPRARSGNPGAGTVQVVARAAGSKAGGTAAGAFLGAFLYFLGVATLRGGPAGARAWLAAKFLNRVA